MNAKKIINEIQRAIGEVKDSEQKTIQVSSLERFLADLDADIDAHGEIEQKELETRLAEFSAQNERNLAAYNASVSSDLEMFRSVILAGQSALKSSLLINGGASVAILAFIGNLATKDSKYEIMISNLSSTLFFFTIGVLCAALGFGTTYASQYSYSREKLKWLGHTFQAITISVVVASYSLFGYASFEAKESFVKKEDANQSAHTTPASAPR
ncbi:hypothetical protein [Pelagicoccus sp. SDUM812003]|uniref:hypothetical protein n=1 Tax=Pelagicoccus sp. SDUM812003 TaxID=3041267 RepID=UPI00280E0057|nr:hypothetical protein [Pelagicoccus sp. SDUM812003]MDQ8205839.1 hypothetical protein [Pelagicoccus sp. SDUM812003]